MPETSTPSSAQVLEALERVLSSPSFLRAERQSRLLRHIVELTAKGDSSGLRETSIGVEVYGRSADFDPKTDPIVRVEASRLRARLAEYYDSIGKDDSIRITVPRGGYVPEFNSVRQLDPVPPPSATPPQPPLPVQTPKLRWQPLAVILLILSATAWFFFSRADKGRTAADPEVAELLKRAYALSVLYTPASTEQARVQLEQAAQLAPNSAEVQATLAGNYMSLASLNSATRQEYGRKALAAAQRAKDLAPDSAFGYQALIRYHRDVTQDLSAAHSICQQAQARAFKQKDLLGSCATVESYLGNHEVAWTLAEENFKLNPTVTLPLRILGQIYYSAGRFDRARETFLKMVPIAGPGRITHWQYLAMIRTFEGQPAHALAELDRQVPPGSSTRVDYYACRGYVAAKAGRTSEVQEMLRIVRNSIEKDGAPAVSLAWIHIGLGEIEPALAALEKSVERREDTAMDFIADPASAPLRREPRFLAAAKRLGMAHRFNF